MKKVLNWIAEMLFRNTILILFVCMFFLGMCMGGCASPYAKMGVYHQRTYTNVSDSVFKSELGLQWEHTDCAWVHLSELDRGSPFNNKHEILGIDMFGCSLKFGGK